MLKNTSLSTMCAMMSRLFSMNLDVNVCNDIKIVSKNNLLKNTSLSRLMYFNINIFQ
jgi:hypothetical protein